MNQNLTVLILFLILAAIPQGKADLPLNALQLDFGSPSATLPLDRILKHEFTAKNAGDKPLNVEFRIFVRDTNQEIVGWPQPQVLYLDPGEEKTVQTFLDELWGKLDRKSTGEHQRTVEWTFRDRETGEERKHVLTYKFTVLSEDKITGNLKIRGRVVDGNKKPVPNAPVTLSTGPGGWSTRTVTSSEGVFEFPGVPKRDGWTLEAGVGSSECLPPPAPCPPPQLSPRRSFSSAFAFVEPGRMDYTLTLKKPALEASYQVTKTERTEIGFWKGEADSNGNVLLINGMENWKEPDLKPKSKLYLYTMDGDLKWAYEMGWEGWGASLSLDGKYAAYVTSNPTKTLGLIDATAGKALWVKRAEEFQEPHFPVLDSKEIKISNTNKYLGVGSASGTLFILELTSGKVLWTQFLKGQIRGIVFDKKDQHVYAGSGDGNAYKLKIEDGSVIWKADIGSWPFVSSFKLSQDESRLAAGGKVGEVTVLQTIDGRKVWENDHLGAVTWLDFSPDGEYLVAGGGGQGATTLYEAKTGSKIWRLNMFSHQGKFSSDGRFILIGDRDLKIVDINGNELGSIIVEDQSKHVGQGQFAYISKDGEKILYTRRDIGPGAIGIVFAQGTVEEVLTARVPEAPEIIPPPSAPPPSSPTATPPPGKGTCGPSALLLLALLPVILRRGNAKY